MTLTVLSTTARSLGPRPLGDVELRHSPAQTVDVSPTRRRITVIAAPYGEQAIVDVEGRAVFESFSNTAWLNVDEQSNRDRMRAVRDHDMVRVFGIVDQLDPLDRRGLIAEIKVSRTQLGDETIELCKDRALDCSVGFLVPSDGVSWLEGRKHRRVTRAWLDHLALVASPAYSDARVLTVTDRSATPRIDMVKAQLATDRARHRARTR